MASPIFNSRELYKILNVKYPRQAADLINAKPWGPISGHRINNKSNNQGWLLDKNDKNWITLESASVHNSFAGTFPEVEGNVVRGFPYATIWALIQVSPGRYQIATMDGQYVWVLQGGEDLALILIKAASENSGPDAQWTFEEIPRVRCAPSP